MKAQRTVAAKCVLAVRMDCTNPTSDTYGRGVLVDLEKKLEKLQEPPPSKVIKALPVPREGPTKRRGGKKYVVHHYPCLDADDGYWTERERQRKLMQ